MYKRDCLDNAWIKCFKHKKIFYFCQTIKTDKYGLILTKYKIIYFAHCCVCSGEFNIKFYNELVKVINILIISKTIGTNKFC